jgi:hypothetical protein
VTCSASDEKCCKSAKAFQDCSVQSNLLDKHNCYRTSDSHLQLGYHLWCYISELARNTHSLDNNSTLAQNFLACGHFCDLATRVGPLRQSDSILCRGMLTPGSHHLVSRNKSKLEHLTKCLWCVTTRLKMCAVSTLVTNACAAMLTGKAMPPS